MTTNEPGLADVLQQVIDTALGQVQVSLPAIVRGYDHATQRADVQVIIRRRYQDQDGVSRYLEQPILQNVLVAFPGTDDFGLIFPIDAGQTGLLIIADRSLDEWKANGNSDVSPGDPRRFDLTDGVFFPGLRADSNGQAQSGAIVMYGDDVRLGSSSASDYVALSSLVDSMFSQLASVFNTWVPVPTDGGAALKVLLTTLLLTWPSSTAASKVKAQ